MDCECCMILYDFLVQGHIHKINSTLSSRERFYDLLS